MRKNYSNKTRKNSKYENIGTNLLTITRLLIGFVFIFSGFVKAIDPLGFTYKIEDYLNAFGGIFQSLSTLAFISSIALSTFELVLGLNLVFKIKIKSTIYLALLFMLVMIPLTLYIALKNPVTDCGCFGDALVISNWETFYKNIVISLLLLVLLIWKKKIHPLLLPKAQIVTVLFFIGTGIALSAYCYRHLPFIDFRPYKIGVNIPAAMIIPPGAPTDKYATTFIYKKNGVEKEFTLENYPKDDSTWIFVDQKTVLISKGYQPKIHNFSIVNSDYVDITDEVLKYPAHSFLLVMYDVNKSSEEGAKKAEQIFQQTLKSGVKFYALTASTDDEIENFKKKTGITFQFYKADPITLKTMVRANPGLILIKKGTVIGNWHWRDFLVE